MSEETQAAEQTPPQRELTINDLVEVLRKHQAALEGISFEVVSLSGRLAQLEMFINAALGAGEEEVVDVEAEVVDAPREG